MKYYTTGTFAKLANVSERTIRYYDKIGLLKPSFIKENGYRQYCEKDLLKLQKIVALRHLGFSLEEIYPLVEKEQDIQESFQMQIELIDTKMAHLQTLKDTLIPLSKQNVQWQDVVSVVRLFNIESKIVEHYKNATNLNIRISLHDQYSTNPMGWFTWLFEQIDFSKVYRLLEVGCGNGKLWSERKIDLRNREIFLTDASKGMVDEVRKRMGQDFNCLVADVQSIPFKDDYFDALIANHVLFYAQSMETSMKEIRRVLKPGGILYCSTYGKNHMKEITDLVKEFDDSIELSENSLAGQFGLENGKDILSPYFDQIEKRVYEDSLRINKAQPLIDYIMSCHGNQNEILGPQLSDFKKFIQDKISKKGYIEITKEAGLFIAN